MTDDELPLLPGERPEMFGPDYVTPNDAAHARAVIAELARRKIEALRLYEPLPEQQRFHADGRRTRLVRGSNRGGKTLPAAVEIARAVTGQDPYGKYPKEDGRCFAVGKDQRHIGQVMWRKLSRADAFKMIRDRVTNQWRAFRPWNLEDLDREAQAKWAPPLIPPRMIKEIAWELKKENVPAVVRLTNGWEISFYSSLGKPPQGSDIDLWWFDEEIVDPEWFPEISARTLDRMGRGVWSATPQAGTDQLFELHERAEANDPDVGEFVILLADNPHIKEAAKVALAKDLTDEQRAVRIGGDFAILGFKVYPEFSMAKHGVEPFEFRADDTFFMVVDPGYQVCAVLFGMVRKGEAHLNLYDELYLQDCDSNKFAEAVQHKTIGKVFQAFYIDPHMGIHSELGTGRTVMRQYSDALAERKIRSRATGSEFLLASDDVQGGLLAVHDALRVRADGTTKLRVFRGRLPNFEAEIKRYHRKRVGGVIVEAPNNRGRTHLMDATRYMVLADPKWVKPSAGKTAPSGAKKAFLDKQERRRSAGEGSFINLGPGVGNAR